MKKLKRKLLKIMLYTTVWGMWTSMLVFGFMNITVY